MPEEPAMSESESPFESTLKAVGDAFESVTDNLIGELDKAKARIAELEAEVGRLRGLEESLGAKYENVHGDWLLPFYIGDGERFKMVRIDWWLMQRKIAASIIAKLPFLADGTRWDGVTMPWRLLNDGVQQAWEVRFCKTTAGIYKWFAIYGPGGCKISCVVEESYPTEKVALAAKGGSDE